MALHPVKGAETQQFQLAYNRVGEAASGQTYGEQLTALQTAYNSMTNIEKSNSWLQVSSNVFRAASNNGKSFSKINLSSSHAQLIELNIVDATYKISTDGGAPIDYSTMNNSNKMYLYTLKITEA